MKSNLYKSICGLKTKIEIFNSAFQSDVSVIRSAFLYLVGLVKGQMSELL